ncbi:MAG: plasmid pRiA4b ORF-3 family protein [Methanobrevibacter sp.]|jgi:hypothetical protein|nr:plasmid pRiA4b ORF-3 family protein [Methanobrevibacter sp.]
MVKNNFTSYTLDVWYSENGEEYYRIIDISGEDTLDNLSEFILKAFDFDNDHLYAFSLDGDFYGENSYHLNSPENKSTNIPIKKVITQKIPQFRYLFDFGDEWLFIIDVKKIEYVTKQIKPKIVESVGKLEQYPDFDDEDEY